MGGGSIVNKNKKEGKEDKIEEGIGHGQLYSPKYAQHLPVTNPNDPNSPNKMEDDAEKQRKEKKGGQDCDDVSNNKNAEQEEERKKMSDESPKSALFTSRL